MITLSLASAAAAVQGHLYGDDVVFTGCSIDSRGAMAGMLFVALRGARFDGHDFVGQAAQQGAVALLVARRVECDLPQIVVADTVVALGLLARYWFQLQRPQRVIGVTGSNGKTTTKEMLTAIFAQRGEVLATSGNFNNEVGMPLTLLRADSAQVAAILEMGASKAGDIAYLTGLVPPDVGVITLCAPSHLEGFGSLDGVARAKGEMYAGIGAGGTAVVNAGDVYADFWRGLIAGRDVPIGCLSFGLGEEADVYAADLVLGAVGSEFVLCTPQGKVAVYVPLAGLHNVLNALAASACALAGGCSLVEIAAGLAGVKGVKGRIQRLAGIRGSLLLDDSYNANPASLRAGLAVLGQQPAPRWLVLGDMKELGGDSRAFHLEAAAVARAAGVDVLWGIGEMAEYTVAAFGVGGRHFVSHAALLVALQVELPAEASVLIKGSRSMRMDIIVDGLRVEG